MNVEFLDLVSDMIVGKDPGHFVTHGLGELLAEMGAAHDSAAIRALTKRLIEDEAYGLVVGIAAGLRETASDGDEFIQMVGAAVDMIRNDIGEGPVINAFISVGKAKPSVACRIAQSLIKRGDSEYAAFLIGGAYASSAQQCDDMIESLASSGRSADIAASLLSMRVAYTEHGTPDAGRITDAIGSALRVDDDGVCREAMEALLDIHGADRERTGPMIRELAGSREVCKPLLATSISRETLFDDDECIDYMDVCVESVSGPGSDVVHSAYLLLKRLAGTRPEMVTRPLVNLAERGAYVDHLAGPVIAELGKTSPEAASGAILSLLKRAPKKDVKTHLSSMVRHAVKFADPASISGPILAALNSEPEMSRYYLLALAELSIENCLGNNSESFASNLLKHMPEHTRHSGSVWKQVDASPADLSMACYNLISGIIHNAEPGASSPPLPQPNPFGRASEGLVVSMDGIAGLPGKNHDVMATAPASKEGG